MDILQAPVTHLTALTLIRRPRILPVPGRVLVNVGQKVSATDVIAEGQSFDQHILIDVRRALGIARIDESEKLIERIEGDQLQKGDLIAQSQGLLSRMLRSPVDGEIVAIHNGRVLIEVPGESVRLQAGFSGTVAEIIAERGAIIETNGALLQGLWGNNRFNQGTLLNICRAPDEELTAARLDVSMRGAVVMAGFCADSEALRTAEELALRGLILPGISADLVAQASAMSVPVIAMGGFGRIPYDSNAYRILTTSERRDACVKASARNRYNGDTPEVILPLPAQGVPAPEVLTLKAGRSVRIQGAPYAAMVGAITQLRSGLTRLASGLNAPAADVRLENNDTVTVPLANLDVLE